MKDTMKTTAIHLGRTYGIILLFGLIAIPIGALIGGLDALFGFVLDLVTGVRDANAIYFIPFLAVAGVLIVFCYSKFGGNSIKGMGLVFEVGNGDAKDIPLRLVPFVMISTWLTHLFGGSAGREGVAVQIGATCSHWIGKRLPFKNSSRIFLVTGMAAGFAGLFGTPIASVLFAMEVLVASSLELRALLPALTAAFTASYVSKALGLSHFHFNITTDIPFDLSIIWKLVLLGLIFGVVGGLFAWCLKWAKKLAAKWLKNPLIRIAVMGLGLSAVLMLLFMGRYSGLGTNLINYSFHGEQVFAYDWILKFSLTILTLAAGFQGGEVTPLFSIGASLGVALAGVFHLPIVLVAALGYASVFGSATNTLLAPMLIGAEIFGYQNLPYFFIVCVISYIFNMNQSIYSLQKYFPWKAKKELKS